MVLFYIGFGFKETPSRNDFKDAQKRLHSAVTSDSYPSGSNVMTQSGYIRLKRVVELYLKKLPLFVMKKIRTSDAISELLQSETPETEVDSFYDRVSFVKYFRGLSERPLDLIVDAFDPNDQTDVSLISSSKNYYKFTEDLDEVLSDALLEQVPENIDVLADIQGDFRAQKILRTIGDAYYMGLDSTRFNLYHELISLE